MEHYFSENPKSQFIKERFDIEVLGEKFVMNSGSGIFSLKELDFGTKLLIENAKIPRADCTILDLGCGYGIVGIAIKRKYPNTNVTMIDVNDRAVKLARQNCEENNVQCTVIKSDIFNHSDINKKKFDVILTNPPFSAGKKTCIEIIKQSHEHLNKNGLLQLVAPHNKGGESLKKIMLLVFNNVGELEKKRGYRVYISINK
jgi:16S rRNA G1207 methylase RsmC